MKNSILLLLFTLSIHFGASAQTDVPYQIDQVRPSNFTIWATGSTVDQGYALYQTDTQNKWIVVSKDIQSPPKRLVTYSYDHAAVIESSGAVRYIFRAGGGRWVTYLVKSVSNAKDIIYASYPSSGIRPFYILGNCKIKGVSKNGIFKKESQHDLALVHSDATTNQLIKIAVDSKEVIYGVTSDGRLVVNNNGRWINIATNGVKAKDLHFEYDQSNAALTMYIQATDGQIFKQVGNSFKALPMDGTSFGCTSNGKLYASTSGREVLILEKDGKHYGKKLTVPKATPKAPVATRPTTSTNNNTSGTPGTTTTTVTSDGSGKTTTTVVTTNANTSNNAPTRTTAPASNSAPSNLKQAVASGDRNAAAKFVLTEDVNQTDKQGNTLLKAAVDAGDYNMAKILLDNGANQNTKQPIVSAVEQGNTQLVTLLAEKRADLKPGLEKAVDLNDTQMFNLLISKGGRANNQMMKKAMDNNNADIVAASLSKGASTATALTYAKTKGDDNMVLLAVNKGAKPETAYTYAIDRNKAGLAADLLQSKNGNANQFLGMAFNKKNIGMAEIALQQGANANQALSGPIQRKDTEQLDLLLKYKASSDKIFTDALQANNLEIATYAIENGAKISAKNFKLACTNGHLSLVELMVEKGANANDGIGEAVTKNHTPIAIFLLDAGADAGDQKLLISAVGHNNSQLVNRFLDAGQNPQDGMLTAIKRDHLSMVKLLVEKGADPKNAMLLGEAVTARRTNIANYLIDEEAPVTYTNNSGENLVHLSVAAGDVPLATRIIEMGVAIETADKIGNTPMHVAVSNKRHQMVTLLHDKGTDINAKNNQGETPLHLAVKEKNNAALISLLAQSGADVNATNGAGKSLIKTAKGAKNKKMLKSLGAQK